MSCTCGSFTRPLSFPATPTYVNATINEDPTEAPVSQTLAVEYHNQLKAIVGVANLEDAFIGCENGSNNVCSNTLNYDASHPVVYTFVGELNPRYCRFMRAWDAARNLHPTDSTFPHFAITISPYSSGANCGGSSSASCISCPYCVSTKRCTDTYPTCHLCPP
jgi:hypothetical protein